MLKCTKCQESKLPEEMSLDKSRRNGLSSWCKSCRKVSARTWKVKYPEKAEKSRIDRNLDYKINPPDYLKTRAYMIKARYGISMDDYNKTLELQNNSCAICKKSVDKISYHLHVDHCHNTGIVRGLLCAPCNVYLGYIKDNIEILTNASNYLTNNKERNLVNAN